MRDLTVFMYPGRKGFVDPFELYAVLSRDVGVSIVDSMCLVRESREHYTFILSESDCILYRLPNRLIRISLHTCGAVDHHHAKSLFDQLLEEEGEVISCTSRTLEEVLRLSQKKTAI